MADAERPIEMSLGQAFGLARLAERAGEQWLFGDQPLTAAFERQHNLNAWHDGELLHVLIHPPGRWHALDRAGEEVAVRAATRAEIMTMALRGSVWWSGMRRLLAERGLDPARTVLAEAFDDAENEDVGVLVTADEAVVEWRRRYSEEDPTLDELLEWRDITASWQDGPWADRVEDGLTVQRHGFRR